MPNPNRRGTIKTDAALSNLSIKYSNGSLIADEVCKRVGVNSETGIYYIFGRNDFRVRQTLRADHADPNYVNAYSTTTGTYACEEHSLSDYLSDRERGNADPAIDPAFAIVNGLTDMLMVAREKRVADLYTATASWGSNYATLSGTEQWNNASFDSDSKTDAIEVRIDTAKEAIRAATGRDPNTIIIPSAVSRVVKKDPEIRELIKYTQSDLLVNGDLPPTMFNMKVYIPGGISDSAEEGQTFSGADLWGKHVVLLYLDPNPMALRTFTAGLTMEAQARQVIPSRDDKRKSDEFEVCEILDEKVVAPGAGYVIRNVIA